MSSEDAKLTKGCIWQAPPLTECGQVDSQLRRPPGKSHATAFDAIISAIIIYHHKIFGCKQGNDKGHHYVQRRDRNYLRIYCYSCKNCPNQENCTFKLKAKMINNEAEITDSNLLHSCGGGGSERARNISTKQIQSVDSGAVEKL